ncbi:MAG: tyrosine-type recombinase/integrase [Phycisphaerales bacterium]
MKANPKRFYFVTQPETEQVLDACPNAQWRLLFALARYGGLRVPSEVLRLRWRDIDWEHGRFVVASPKTEHHEGGESRVVPIFPELQPYLMETFELAEAGTEYCITRYRHPGVNLRTQLMRIIKRAGLKPWPKLWQNLRSTRETELADSFPAHVASAWIGNSVQVAVKHYLQVTDDHFAQAVRNPVQHSAAGGRAESQELTPDNEKPAICSAVRKEATPCENTESSGMGDTGLEPVTSRV